MNAGTCADNAPFSCLAYDRTSFRRGTPICACSSFHGAAGSWRSSGTAQADADLVIYFGLRAALACGARYRELRAIFPNAHILGCSTGGQIRNDDVFDDEIAAVAFCFDKHAAEARPRADAPPRDSTLCGTAIGQALAADDLAGIFVLSDGLNVNGSALVAGITGASATGIPFTGGLAGDGAQFEETLVGGDGAPRRGRVAAVGFYGNASASATAAPAAGMCSARAAASQGQTATSCYELDGEPALDLYERYLGEEDAKGLPGTALLFPLQIYDPRAARRAIVRTILAVDRDARSMTFAGDVPEGWVAQLMRGNFDRLSAGAADAARQAHRGIGEAARRRRCDPGELHRPPPPDGPAHCATKSRRRAPNSARKFPRLGFYSYGEISPHARVRRLRIAQPDHDGHRHPRGRR